MPNNDVRTNILSNGKYCLSPLLSSQKKKKSFQALITQHRSNSHPKEAQEESDKKTAKKK